MRRRIEEEAQRNKQNYLENIKDINLLLGDVKDIKRKLDEFDSKVDTSLGEGLTTVRLGSQSDFGST